MGAIVVSRTAFLDKWLPMNLSKEQRAQADEELRRLVFAHMMVIENKKPSDLGLRPGDLPKSLSDFAPCSQEDLNEWNRR